MLDISPVLRAKAEATGSQDWLGQLPALIEQLENAWQIEVGPAIEGGTEAYVAQATMPGGGAAVLKLLLPGQGAGDEIRVLQLAAGEGCATLLRSNEDVGALLLERLGRPLSELDVPVHERHEILCAAAMRLWRPIAPGLFPTGADKARWLVD